MSTAMSRWLPVAYGRTPADGSISIIRTSLATSRTARIVASAKCLPGAGARSGVAMVATRALRSVHSEALGIRLSRLDSRGGALLVLGLAGGGPVAIVALVGEHLVDQAARPHCT